MSVHKFTLHIDDSLSNKVDLEYLFDSGMVRHAKSGGVYCFEIESNSQVSALEKALEYFKENDIQVLGVDFE